METKQFQLPKEFATKWVEALRSGGYKQAKSYLKAKEGYCCLGIACKIQGISDLDIFGRSYPKNIVVPLNDKIPNILLGDADGRNFLGIVSLMNDNGKTFKEIADWIERNVEFI